MGNPRAEGQEVERQYSVRVAIIEGIHRWIVECDHVDKGICLECMYLAYEDLYGIDADGFHPECIYGSCNCERA